jgi:signal transduction histidine kinase
MAREQLDLSVVAREFVNIAHSIVRKQARVIVDVTSTPLPIHVDRAFLDQALLNLVTNAAQAMTVDGTLTLETSRLSLSEPQQALGTSLPAGTFARLTVRDTGVGMARDDLSHIFEPFYTTRGEVGTGLGLAVVYGGVRQHEGHVAVESEPGRGTAFHLLFPLVS